jgi:hypothetical protein
MVRRLWGLDGVREEKATPTESQANRRQMKPLAGAAFDLRFHGTSVMA